jgi:hypothetical protein
MCDFRVVLQPFSGDDRAMVKPRPQYPNGPQTLRDEPDRTVYLCSDATGTENLSQGFSAGVPSPSGDENDLSLSLITEALQP